MKTSNRDLLVLVKDEFQDAHNIEKELASLNKLLVHVETNDTFCVVNEVLDFNKYRILTKKKKVLQVLNSDNLKPFVFISNKN